MAGAEAEGWETRVDICPVIVVIGDAEMTSVFCRVAVGVADERAFPLQRGLLVMFILSCKGFRYLRDHETSSRKRSHSRLRE